MQQDVKVLLYTGSRHLTYDVHYAGVLRHTMLAIYQLKGDSDNIKIVCRHGDAEGGDSLFAEAVNKAKNTLSKHGCYLDLDPIPYFKHLGVRGGPERNKFMVNKDPKPSLCLSQPFYGMENKGTKGCTALARSAGIEILSRPLDKLGRDVIG